LNQRKRILAALRNLHHHLFPLSGKRMKEKILPYPPLLLFRSIPLQCPTFPLSNPLQKPMIVQKRFLPLQRKTTVSRPHLPLWPPLHPQLG
jgi:hypothetical protein